MRYLITTILITLISSISASEIFSKGKWIDLTHNLSEQAIFWPTADTFKKTTVFEGHTDNGYYYSAFNFSTSEHGGTHLDAPIHFAENRLSTDQIPIDQLIGNGVVIRISEKVLENRNYQFSVDDILQWEKNYGQIPKNSILLIDTGSSKYWPNKKQYMGTEKRGAEGVKELKFPGIHPEAAKFLVTKRKIKAVGLDTPSIDFGGSKLFESHRILYDKNIVGFENVANLDQLPATGVTIIALPTKIQGGSGGPLRIVAFVPN
ncbi:MAG: cyclase family protein [Gammaproteobacteria bacterium]|nr:cyclase family protein [Gammaproteobacteria bacterium]